MAAPFDRGDGLPRSLGRAVGLPPPPRSLGRGGGPASPATRPPTMDGFNGGGFPNFSGGFPFPSPLDGSCGGGFSISSSLLDAAGQFTSGRQGVPTMILEAVASKNLRIWHAFFGTPGLRTT